MIFYQPDEVVEEICKARICLTDSSFQKFSLGINSGRKETNPRTHSLEKNHMQFATAPQ